MQYYAFLKHNKIPLENVYNAFPNDEGNPYCDFLDYKYYAENQKNNITDNDIRNLFGIGKKEYFNRLENADKRYKTKMMKAATKTNLSTTRLARRLNFTVKCYKNGIIEEASEFD